MIEAKHTPGPWHWVGSMWIDGPNGETVLECGDDGKDWGLHSARLLISDADRTLIVAAPELLEALRGLLPQTFTGNPTQAQLTAHWERERELGNEQAQFVLAAYAAIAKATGEPL